MSDEILVTGVQRLSLLKPFERIALTKTKLILGNEIFLLKDISEVSNDYNRFTGTSKVGFRRRNGQIIKGS